MKWRRTLEMFEMIYLIINGGYFTFDKIQTQQSDEQRTTYDKSECETTTIERRSLAGSVKWTCVNK